MRPSDLLPINMPLTMLLVYRGLTTIHDITLTHSLNLHNLHPTNSPNSQESLGSLGRRDLVLCSSHLDIRAVTASAKALLTFENALLEQLLRFGSRLKCMFELVLQASSVNKAPIYTEAPTDLELRPLQLLLRCLQRGCDSVVCSHSAPDPYIRALHSSEGYSGAHL